MHTIYRIVCFRAFKVYVGQTFAKYEANRFRCHFSNLRDSKHHSKKLQDDYNLYGRGAFYLEVIERDVPSELVDEREKYYIAYYDSFLNGYNGNPGDNSKPCEWNGVRYPSMGAAARQNAYDDGDMRYFVSKGYKGDTDIPAECRRAKKWYLLSRLQDQSDISAPNFRPLAA